MRDRLAGANPDELPRRVAGEASSEILTKCVPYLWGVEVYHDLVVITVSPTNALTEQYEEEI